MGQMVRNMHKNLLPVISQCSSLARFCPNSQTYCQYSDFNIPTRYVLCFLGTGICTYNLPDHFVPPSASLLSAGLLLAVIILYLLFHKSLLFANTADSISFLPPSVNKPFIGLFIQWTIWSPFPYEEKPVEAIDWLDCFPSTHVHVEDYTGSCTHIQSMTFIKWQSESIFEPSVCGRLIRRTWSY